MGLTGWLRHRVIGQIFALHGCRTAAAGGGRCRSARCARWQYRRGMTSDDARLGTVHNDDACVRCECRGCDTLGAILASDLDGLGGAADTSLRTRQTALTTRQVAGAMQARTAIKDESSRLVERSGRNYHLGDGTTLLCGATSERRWIPAPPTHRPSPRRDGDQLPGERRRHVPSGERLTRATACFRR